MFRRSPQGAVHSPESDRHESAPDAARTDGPSTDGPSDDVAGLPTDELAVRWVERGGPWAISLLLHLGLGLLAVFIVWSLPDQAADEPYEPPTIQQADDHPPRPLDRTERIEDASTTEIPRDIQTVEIARGDPLSDYNREVSVNPAQLGVAGGAAMPIGSHVGRDERGTGIYRPGEPAESIVYVVDASGSLVDTLHLALGELDRAIRNLDEEQRFSVIFFQRDKAIEVAAPHRGLKAATDDHKRAVRKWLDPASNRVTPGGSSNPVAALERALRLKPEVIYLLSDNITGQGEYAVEQRELLSRIERAKNRFGSRTRIHTIQFLTPDPLGTLKEIADAHNGQYRFVDYAEAAAR